MLHLHQLVLAGAKGLGTVVLGLVIGAVHPNDLVLLELAVEVGVTELHRVEADPPGVLSIEPDTGHAHGLAVGLAGVRVGLDRNENLYGLLSWSRCLQPRVAISAHFTNAAH